MQHVKHESFIAHIEELMLYFITILFTLHIVFEMLKE